MWKSLWQQLGESLIKAAAPLIGARPTIVMGPPQDNHPRNSYTCQKTTVLEIAISGCHMWLLFYLEYSFSALPSLKAYLTFQSSAKYEITFYCCVQYHFAETRLRFFVTLKKFRIYKE